MRTKLIEVPVDKGAEGAVIGSLVIEPKMIPEVVECISKEDFSTPEAAELFGIIIELWAQGKAIDGVLISSEIKGLGNEENLHDYLSKAMDSVPCSVNAPYYAKHVKNKSVERQLIQAVDNVNDIISSPGETTNDKLVAIKKLLNICPDAENDEIDLCTLIDQYFLSNKDNTGIPTGFSYLDFLTDGLKRGQLILVGGPSSIGKSSFALDMFINAMRLGTDPYMVSLEMFNDEIAERMIRNIGRVKSGFSITDPKAIEAAKFIGSWPGSLAARRDTDIDVLCSQILSKKQRDGIGIVFIDHLHLIAAPGRSGYERVTYISKALKTLAMQAEIPVVVAAQLNRAPRNRTDHRPFMTDLRDSGSLEQDADVVLLLYSEDYYRKQDNPEAELDGTAECIVSKNRNRATGVVKLIWFPEYSTFVSRSDSKWDE